MTDNTRAELRRRVEELVQWASLKGARVKAAFEADQQSGNYITGVTVFMPDDVDDDAVPPLTTAQQLALSVLVGEPDRAVLSALCDCLIEMGHEYAAAVAEKATMAERERCLRLMDVDHHLQAESRSGLWQSYERIHSDISTGVEPYPADYDESA